ncbi:MAG: putative Ig domain-containing protein [Candidatus Omnitrophica bacterium]|nr:putative Ig domain-containing protein [Candidatus Omnitrophota bacterium]
MEKIINKKVLILLSLLLFLTLFSGCFLFPPTNQAPTITSTQITTATVDELYTYDVDATDLDGDTLTYSLTTNPSGMTIDSTSGLINWTPTSAQIGDHNVTVEVSDGKKSATQSFVIEVIEAEGPGYTPTPSTPPKTYTITASAGPGGSISPSGIVTVNQGSDISFTVTPDTGYQITNVLVDGSSVGAVEEYTFENVKQNHTIQANFSEGVSEPEWLGDPQCIPDTIFTLESTDVRFHILVNKEPDDLASESPVKLFKKDGNTSWVLLDEMFDDGDLDNHGDEIKGDRTYSNIIEFYEEHSKDIPLKIVVTTSDNQQYSVEFSLSVVEDVSEKIIKDTDELSDLAEQKVIEIMQSPPSNLEAVIQMLSDYLAELTYVESCEIFGNTIKITFDTGVLMEIQLINLDEEEPLEGENLSIAQEGSNLSSTKNREAEYIPIPLENQTTGGDGFSDSLSKGVDDYLSSKDVAGFEYIGNQDVLVYDPFYTFWTKWNIDVGSHYQQLLDNSGIDFNIEIYRDYQADIETLRTMVEYGLVIIHTHGSGSTFATGLEANETNKNIYSKEMSKKPREVYISKHLAVSWKWFGLVEVYEDRLGVTVDWFNTSNFIGKLPNSIVFNNSCYNGNENFYNAFDSIGAATYYGHSGTHTRPNAIECTTEVLEGLIGGKTTGEAYVPRSGWEIFGKDNVKIPVFTPFSNGSFEDDFLNWKKEGDGRVIPALAFLKPTEGTKMAIISTGLGYTEKYGAIFQTFTVGNNDTALQFDWNYLSEEFLEWIGSIYQDPFKVTLTKVDDSSTTTLLYKTVDSIAADFGATQEYGGDLIYLSPDIIFDRGDVWMNGWQTFQCDISAFQGNTVTIKFEAEDLGDEIYDTAILLDNIKIY